MHPTVQQLASVRILSHPTVAPILQSVLPQPVNSVPVPAERVPMIVTSDSGATKVQQGEVGESSPGPAHPGEGFWLIARTPPPAGGPAFAEQLSGLRQNAGRPLDPVQWKNLASGRPAGPITAPESPPSSPSSTNGTSRPNGEK